MNQQTQKSIPSQNQSRELNALLQVAKNYLEQEIEASGFKPSVVFGPYKGVTVYHNGTSIVAIADKEMLKIFHENVSIDTLEVPTKVDSARLTEIKSVAAQYCKRCRVYFEKHEGLTHCRCGKYLKPRKRFFIGENRVVNSDEMAEVQFAIKDARIAERIDATRKTKHLVSKEISYELGGLSCKNDKTRSKSCLMERIMTIRVDGNAIPQDCIVQMILSLAGPDMEEISIDASDAAYRNFQDVTADQLIYG
jgi:hypothetical protein